MARTRLPAAPKPQSAGNGLPTITERQFQRQVLTLAELLGWRHWHDNATNAPRACPKCKQPIHLPRNSSGLPDLILVRRPRLIWVELKSQAGVVSDEQRAWIADLRASGQEVYIWRPSQWSEIEQALAATTPPDSRAASGPKE